MRSFITYTLLSIITMIKSRRMRSCSMNGGKEEYIKDNGRKARRKESTKKIMM
jgi:hypothetical protein